MKKIVFISHGHPDLSKGGAEVASWNLYKLLQRKGYDCLYIARTDGASHGGSTFSRRGEEVLFHTGMNEWFTLSTSNLKPLFKDLGSMLKEFAPDVVHMHHYAHMGIEMFRAIKLAVPKAKLVFTLHEFMAMCMHNGQMVKTETLKLCNEALPADCHKCFPGHSPGDFFLRKQYLLDQFSYVDAFISPSYFLADRYTDWGIPKQRMHVIENVLPSVPMFSPRPIAEGEKRTRLAFFGQINPYKGLDILLEAIARLPAHLRQKISLDVHGANLEKQPAEFQNKVRALLDETRDVVQLCGPYEPSQLPSRMESCDWVVIPSIWWENSPVVIQEAIHYGRPLIGSNIGGMYEKISGVAGLTFEARNTASLAKVIEQAAEPDVFDFWQQKLAPGREPQKAHLAFLNDLFSDINVND